MYRRPPYGTTASVDHQRRSRPPLAPRTCKFSKASHWPEPDRNRRTLPVPCVQWRSQDSTSGGARFRTGGGWTTTASGWRSSEPGYRRSCWTATWDSSWRSACSTTTSCSSSRRRSRAPMSSTSSPAPGPPLPSAASSGWAASARLSCSRYVRYHCGTACHCHGVRQCNPAHPVRDGAPY